MNNNASVQFAFVENTWFFIVHVNGYQLTLPRISMDVLLRAQEYCANDDLVVSRTYIDISAASWIRALAAECDCAGTVIGILIIATGELERMLSREFTPAA